MGELSTHEGNTARGDLCSCHRPTSALRLGRGSRQHASRGQPLRTDAFGAEV